jgi:hypothetical protein
MPTISDILAALNFEKWAGRDEGSCFGVNRPIPRSRNLCKSCREGVHECAGKVRVFSIHMKEIVDQGDRDRRMVPETTSSELPCECYKCAVVTEQPARDTTEVEKTTSVVSVSSCEECNND